MDKEKPTILAICGPSSAGKDSLSIWLRNDINHRSNDNTCANLIISDTTRPMRKKEKQDVAYHFCSEEEFFERPHLESSSFRGWHYGTPQEGIKEGHVNIGIFNADGIAALLKFKEQYNIVPILIEDFWWLRLLRSYGREGKWKLEYFRRAVADFFDFRRLKKEILPQYSKIVHLKNLDGVIRKTEETYKQLEWFQRSS